MAQEMRRRLQSLNSSYTSRSAQPCLLPLLAGCPARCAGALQAAVIICLPAHTTCWAVLRPAGENVREEKAKLEAQLAAKEAALEAERSAKLDKLTHLESSNEALRLGQGKFQQQLAKREYELEREREMAQEMRNRLKQLNSTYLTSGGFPSRACFGHVLSCAACASSCCLRRITYYLPACLPTILQGTRCAPRCRPRPQSLPLPGPSWRLSALPSWTS
jgi:hypothetical protein